MRDPQEQAAHWFFEGPERQAIALLGLLEPCPEPPKWAARWLAWLLMRRPADAERIHALRMGMLDRGKS